MNTLEKKCELLYATGLFCTEAHMLRNELIQNLFARTTLNMAEVIKRHEELVYYLEQFRRVMMDLHLEQLKSQNKETKETNDEQN